MISNKKRDWLLSQSETFSMSTTTCRYLGNKYYYKPVTDEEILKKINNVMEILGDKENEWELVE